MKFCIRSAAWTLLLAAAIGLCGLEPVQAYSVGQPLNAENIAVNSLSVAESMKTSGYCYTGVSKAVSPLGVSLTGAAAYQARELLLADVRFTPISLNDSGDLQRGDIIVFNKSASHPYGHICVYQGNGQESSDHVSQLTSPSAYGGVTVFRLCSENNYIEAPDFRRPNSIASSPQSFQQQNYGSGQSDSVEDGLVKRTKDYLAHRFHISNSSSTGRVLTTKLIRFVMRNL